MQTIRPWYWPARGQPERTEPFTWVVEGVIAASWWPDPYVFDIYDEQNIRADYLAWFLRTDVAAAHFALRRKGTLVQTVQRKDVLELELPLPPLAKQDILIALDALAIQERQLSTELALKKASYTQRLMLHAASS